MQALASGSARRQSHLRRPFLGAFAAELYVQKSEVKLALRAAFGSLVGVLAGSFLKLALVLWMSYIFYAAL